jgi:outer membrane biogenesis lipoprotein LolB
MSIDRIRRAGGLVLTLSLATAVLGGCDTSSPEAGKTIQPDAKEVESRQNAIKDFQKSQPKGPGAPGGAPAPAPAPKT